MINRGPTPRCCCKRKDNDDGDGGGGDGGGGDCDFTQPSIECPLSWSDINGGVQSVIPVPPYCGFFSGPVTTYEADGQVYLLVNEPSSPFGPQLLTRNCNIDWLGKSMWAFAFTSNLDKSIDAQHVVTHDCMPGNPNGDLGSLAWRFSHSSDGLGGGGDFGATVVQFQVNYTGSGTTTENVTLFNQDAQADCSCEFRKIKFSRRQPGSPCTERWLVGLKAWVNGGLIYDKQFYMGISQTNIDTAATRAVEIEMSNDNDVSNSPSPLNFSAMSWTVS